MIPKLKAFFAKAWKTIFNLQSLFERLFRALIAVLSASGLAFADQVAQYVGEPLWAKWIRVGSIGAAFVQMMVAAGQKNRTDEQIRAVVAAQPAAPSISPPAPPAAGGPPS